MAENKIELKSVSELLGMKFFIPSYQRGYRWTEQQVKDLLNDIREFLYNNNDPLGYYCLQPIVVKEKETEILKKIKEADSLDEVKDLLKGEWEVIDGQQRLTTICIILFYINGKTPYSIDYETRDAFEDFLSDTKDKFIQYDLKIDDDKTKQAFKEIVKKEAQYDNIDFYHVFTTYCTIFNWFKMHEVDGKKYGDQLLNKVKFIWYESVDEDPIKVFTRLNIGKITLTNAELIRALFLNCSNFGNANDNHLKLRQQEIASEWDYIEYTLQNDEFWLFLHNIGTDRPTRIDFIFDMICDKNPWNIDRKIIGNDEQKTFRYFYEYFRCSGESSLVKCWGEVKKYFNTFMEWYNDLELYHYVGYLINPGNNKGEKLQDLYYLWDCAESKEVFIQNLQNKIKDKIKGCNDLDSQYEINGSSKILCRPLLLLHNIQSIVNQNNRLMSKQEYNIPVFYKFPFHLFKKENWDVEHIDSNTANGLEKEKDQKEWLKYSVIGGDVSKELKERIRQFVSQKDSAVAFDELCQKIESSRPSSWKNPEHDKNKVWNFVLLDAGTNRGYGNAIFPAKRRCIIGKDMGKTYIVDDGLQMTEKEGAIAFVPPVTKNVFLKYYNTFVDNLREWSENDAKAYRTNIYEMLSKFGVVDSADNQKKGKNEQ